MLLGHQKQLQYLKRLAQTDKLPHAFLFSGEEKVGKRTTAIEYCKWLLKTDIEQRTHPDFILLEPEKREIQISQVRDCIWRLALKPQLSVFKIAIIDQAHCLNQEAQSAFLKTLEEPKGKALIILITEYSETLFPTILSRVQRIKFYPPAREEIKNYLLKKGIKEDAAQEMIKLSLARPGKIIDFLSKPETLEKQRKAISDFKSIIGNNLLFRFKCAKELAANTREIKEVLESWLGYLRELLISVNHSCQREEILLKKDYSLETLKNNINSIQEINFLLAKANINPRLALETLMLNLDG